MARVVIILLVVLAATSSYATTIHVPSQQPTIQAGVNAAAAGDTVSLAAGTYTGAGNRDIDIDKIIVVMSESTPDFTIIDCQGAGRGFYIHDGTGVGPVIQGLTIKNGSANAGGAIECWSFSVVIKNCLLQDNTATYGGAFYFNPSLHPGGPVPGMSYPNVENCTIVGNTASDMGPVYYSNGDIQTTYSRCLIASNGPGPICCGGGTAVVNCSDLYGNGGIDWSGCIADQASANGNMTADPLFWDAAGGDYHLAQVSPCLPQNNSCGMTIGAFGPEHTPGTIRVPEDQPTIQAGIDAALYGDTVLVSDGTYTGDGNRDIVINKAIAVMSEHGAAYTVVDCEGNAANPHRGVDIQNSQNVGVMIKGFTITGAYTAIISSADSVAIDSCVLIDNFESAASISGASQAVIRHCQIVNTTGTGLFVNGLGLIIDSCSVFNSTGIGLNLYGAYGVVTNCIFKGNAVGIDAYNEDGHPSLIIRRCDFVNNGPTQYGAGLSLFVEPLPAGHVEIDSCDFVGNRASNGGAAYVYANGLGDPGELFRWCTFHDNIATRGGALYLWSTDDIAIEGCDFVGNVADEGGAIFAENTPRTYVLDCTFTANAAPMGSQVYLPAMPVFADGFEITKCIVVGGQSGQAIGCGEPRTAPAVDCSDIWGNAGGDWVGCIADQLGQNGNISDDPLFCDAANGNYSLYNFSPCAATNNSCGQLIGAYDVGCTLAATLVLPDEAVATNVKSHTPTLGWTFEPAPGWTQSEFEIAVGTDPDWTYAEMWNPAPFSSADTQVVYAGAPLVDGATYYARVRCKLNGSWTPWYESSFRMNSLPEKPTLAWPSNGALTNNRPTLYVHNGVDPEGDPLSYQFFLYYDPNALAPLLVSDLIPQQADSTGWTVGEYLTEDSVYVWRCRAWDGHEFSDTSGWFFFAVNGIPEAPSTPTIIAPVEENLILYEMLPTFTWTEATDPDPFDEVRYRLELSLNQNFTLVVPFDNLTDTVYHFADSLSFNTRYWWRVKALDNGGLFSTSASSDFWTWTLGDVNRSHDCTIGDISILIDHLFISQTPINPPKAGDVNGTCDITIGDVSLMIDHLFISGPAFKVGCE